MTPRRWFGAAKDALVDPAVRVSAAERSSGVLTEASIAAAANSMRVNGVCYFEDALGVEWVARARSEVDESFAHCMSRPYPGPDGTLQVGMEHGYKEVVHRAAGRYDVQDGGIGGSPLLLSAGELWEPLTKRLLGVRQFLPHSSLCASRLS